MLFHVSRLHFVCLFSFFAVGAPLAADSAVASAVVKARVCDLRLLVFCRYVFLCIGTRYPLIRMGVALTWFWPGITMAHILGLF
jgi:hypothetical protein